MQSLGSSTMRSHRHRDGESVKDQRSEYCTNNNPDGPCMARNERKRDASVMVGQSSSIPSPHPKKLPNVHAAPAKNLDSPTSENSLLSEGGQRREPTRRHVSMAVQVEKTTVVTLRRSKAGLLDEEQIDPEHHISGASVGVDAKTSKTNHSDTRPGMLALPASSVPDRKTDAGSSDQWRNPSSTHPPTKTRPRVRWAASNATGATAKPTGKQTGQSVQPMGDTSDKPFKFVAPPKVSPVARHDDPKPLLSEGSYPSSSSPSTGMAPPPLPVHLSPTSAPPGAEALARLTPACLPFSRPAEPHANFGPAAASPGYPMQSSLRGIDCMVLRLGSTHGFVSYSECMDRLLRATNWSHHKADAKWHADCADPFVIKIVENGSVKIAVANTGFPA